MCLFHVGHLICWHSIIPLEPCCFCKVRSDVSLFHYRFCNLSFLSFCLVSLAKGLSSLLLFSKNELSVSIILFSSILDSLYLHTNSYYFLPSLGLLFYSLTISFKSKVRLWIWGLSSFIMCVFTAINFSLSPAMSASHKVSYVVFLFFLVSIS